MPNIPAGGSFGWTMYVGVGDTEAAVMTQMRALNVEVYCVAKSSLKQGWTGTWHGGGGITSYGTGAYTALDACAAVRGAPRTFFMAFKGVGGPPI